MQRDRLVRQRPSLVGETARPIKVVQLDPAHVGEDIVPSIGAAHAMDEGPYRRILGGAGEVLLDGKSTGASVRMKHGASQRGTE